MSNTSLKFTQEFRLARAKTAQMCNKNCFLDSSIHWELFIKLFLLAMFNHRLEFRWTMNKYIILDSYILEHLLVTCLTSQLLTKGKKPRDYKHNFPTKGFQRDLWVASKIHRVTFAFNIFFLRKRIKSLIVQQIMIKAHIQKV